MSDFAEYSDRLNLREQIARIDLAQAEVQKLVAETRKLQIDAQLAPWQVAIVSLSAAAGFFIAGVGFLKLMQMPGVAG